MKKIINVMTAAALLFSLAACNNTRKVNLTEGEWVLHSMTYTDGQEHVVTENRPTLVFSDSSSIHGYAGCNNYFGTYQSDGREITVDVVGLTQMLCINSEVEDNFVEMMRRVRSYAIDGHTLHLYNDNKNVIFKFELDRRE